MTSTHMITITGMIMIDADREVRFLNTLCPANPGRVTGGKCPVAE